MEVLIVSASRDYANVGYTLEQCLREVGVDAVSIAAASYRPERAKILRRSRFEKFIKQYIGEIKIVQFMHSLYRDIGLKNKRIFIYHGGWKYREDYESVNKFFNPIVEKSIIQTGDLLGLGAKNERWLLPAIDTENIKPVYERQGKKIIVGHFPSCAMTKNSKGINEVMRRLKKDLGHKFEYIYSPPPLVNWEKQIDRVSKCDIYIEACNPFLKTPTSPKGNIYGEWGVAGIEAAALGCVTISHFLSHKRYEQEYGKCAIKVANSLDNIERHMRNLLSMNDDDLLQAKKDTREWVEKFHSHYAVGKKLKEEIYEI